MSLRPPHSLTQQLGFGQYSDLSVQMIFSGSQSVPSFWCQNTLKEFILSPNALKKISDKAASHLVENYEIEFTRSYIIMTFVKKADGYFEGLDFDEYDLLNDFFVKELKWKDDSYFRPKPIEMNEEGNTSKQYIMPSGAPDYLEWVIKNTALFFMRPAELLSLQNTPVNKWLGFELVKINEEIFKAIPDFTQIRFLFSKEAIELNEQKYQRYLERLSRLRYADGHNLQDYFLAYETYGDYKRGDDDNYSNYGGPSDGHGGRLDDNFIDDALGGEAEAYWNID